MDFGDEVRDRLARNATNTDLKATADAFMAASISSQYSYNFSWCGRPIIQYPQDILAMQELIWRVQPTLIIETGIAHGGSLIFSASMLELLAACGGAANARVLGIDIDIRAHNRKAIEDHPLARRVTMIEGSSTSRNVIDQVMAQVGHGERVLVFLDSSHTEAHVLAELEAYAPLVSVGSYCVVFDTVIEYFPEASLPGRPWSVGNNPGTAAQTYLRTHPEFQVDARFDHKLLVSVAPGGYLERIR